MAQSLQSFTFVSCANRDANSVISARESSLSILEKRELVVAELVRGRWRVGSTRKRTHGHSDSPVFPSAPSPPSPGEL